MLYLGITELFIRRLDGGECYAGAIIGLQAGAILEQSKSLLKTASETLCAPKVVTYARRCAQIPGGNRIDSARCSGEFVAIIA